MNIISRVIYFKNKIPLFLFLFSMWLLSHVFYYFSKIPWKNHFSIYELLHNLIFCYFWKIPYKMHFLYCNKKSRNHVFCDSTNIHNKYLHFNKNTNLFPLIHLWKNNPCKNLRSDILFKHISNLFSVWNTNTFLLHY